MAKRITAQPAFTILVANLAGGSDPSRGPAGNPVKVRTGFVLQHFPDLGMMAPNSTEAGGHPVVETHQGHLTYTVSPVPVGASATIVVANNTFAPGTMLSIGDYTLEADADFVVAGTTALTAVALAAAIDALPGFSSPVPAASTITVTGPAGPTGNTLPLTAYYPTATINYTITPADGSFGSAEPYIGPPLILP